MIPELFAPLKDLKRPPEEVMFHHCAVGHDKHVTTVVQRTLQGQSPNLSAPAIPEHLGLTVAYKIYDWREYFLTVDGNETVSEHGKYCTGQDIISYCIDRQGVWEGDETLVTLDILNENADRKDVVLDFGSHIGYYTMLAALKGYRVASFDGSAENLNLLCENAEINGVSKLVHPHLCWLDENAPPLSAGAENVQLMKCDIEGAEQYAVKMVEPLLEYKKIKYIILEVSPVFNDTYPDTVEKVAGYGYDVYQLPGNNWEHNEEFSTAPLETIKKYCQLKAEGRPEHIANLSQENILFVRREG